MRLDFDFDYDGFLIARDLIPGEMLKGLELATFELIKCAAHDFSIAAPVPGGAVDLLASMERIDKSKFKDFLGFLGCSAEAMEIAVSTQLMTVIRGLQKGPVAPALPGFFFNSPTAEQLQYDWHQESSYYPNQVVISAWLPCFNDVRGQSGPMMIARGSHRYTFPYNIEFRNHGLMQLAVNDSQAEAFEIVPCEVMLGDVVFFHSGVLHRTSANRSGIPRVNLICRYFGMAYGQRLPAANVSAATREDYIKRASSRTERP